MPRHFRVSCGRLRGLTSLLELEGRCALRIEYALAGNETVLSGKSHRRHGVNTSVIRIRPPGCEDTCPKGHHHLPDRQTPLHLAPLLALELHFQPLRPPTPLRLGSEATCPKSAVALPRKLQATSTLRFASSAASSKSSYAP